jgi:hypothetical protein
MLSGAYNTFKCIKYADDYLERRIPVKSTIRARRLGCLPSSHRLLQQWHIKARDSIVEALFLISFGFGVDSLARERVVAMLEDLRLMRGKFAPQIEARYHVIRI